MVSPILCANWGLAVASDLARRFLEVAPGLNLPVPGRGETGHRLRALYDIAFEDLELAKLVEADADARAIAAELDYLLPSGTFGVWASDGPASRLSAVRDGDAWALSGQKQYCTGAGMVSHALVTAHGSEGPLLLCVETGTLGARADFSAWQTPVFEATRTATVTFDETVTLRAVVGRPNEYLDRPGFWGGALSVAACWAGGAAGLAHEFMQRWPRDDAHSLAHEGALHAVAWELQVIIEAAGAQFDRAPREGAVLAGIVRHRIEQLASEVIQRVLRAGGPGPLTHDARLGERLYGLQLFIRQHHAERDMEALGRSFRE